MFQECFHVLARIGAAIRQEGHGLRLGGRKGRVAGGGHDRGERQHLGRVLSGYHLGDHPAHGSSDHVGPLMPQSADQGGTIGGHVGEQIGDVGLLTGSHGGIDLGHVRRTVFVQLARQSDVAIVIADHLIAAPGQVFDHGHRPRGHLRTQAHNQQHGLAGRRAVNVIFQRDAVSGDLRHGVFPVGDWPVGDWRSLWRGREWSAR